ncbi:zinc finger protein 684-like [Ambystoma mexicanum]|uniref:zinc finger protein 684-like n=1 Tax=Ambystoma mexicanum TaxID=8296 RepID=UPI0037E8F607
MPQNRLLKAPVCFSDVAACFSEEEWKLLHEWQNELYSNVMKEVHQALTSLGPLIATSVFSLRANENEEVFPKDNQNLSRRHSGNLSTKHESNLPIVSFVIKEEGETEYIEHQDSETKDSISIHAGFNVCSTDSEASDGGHATAEVEEISTYIMSDDGSMQRKKGIAHLFKCDDNLKRRRPSAGKIKAKVAKRFVKRIPSTSNDWLVNDQEVRDQSKQEDIVFHYPAHSMFDPKIPNLQKSNESEEYQSVMRNANFVPSESNPEQSWRPYACSENQHGIWRGESNIEDQSTQPSKEHGSYIGQEESISAMPKHPWHERAHTRDRPYNCVICGKSFHHKQVFIRHQKIHTGERPYECTVCGKRFRLKEVLMQHQNTHTGERPFQCSLCGKSFSRKGTLVRHQRIHLKEGLALE